MSRPVTRLLATTTRHMARFQTASTAAGVHALRSFTQTCLLRADADPPQPPPERTTLEATPGQKERGMSSPASSADPATRRSILDTPPPKPANPFAQVSASNAPSSIQGLALDTMARAQNQPTSADLKEDDDGFTRENWGDEPFHFHVFAHKHNTHITVTKPNRDAIVSVSAGNIGFRKSRRGTYDAAYQLAAFVVDKLHQGNWHKQITKMEVVLRDFGPGREAASKVLLGSEGRLLRGSIIKVSDATRLKFGGTRSRRPRRLG